MSTKKYEGPKTLETAEHIKAFKRAWQALEDGKPLIDVLIRLHNDYKAIPTVHA